MEGEKGGMLRDVTEEDLPIFFEHQQFSSEETTRPRILQKCGFRQIDGIQPGSDAVEEYLFQLDPEPLVC